MQNYIESENIAAFKARLLTETDPVTRAMLIRLLAEEETKFQLRKIIT